MGDSNLGRSMSDGHAFGAHRITSAMQRPQLSLNVGITTATANSPSHMRPTTPRHYNLDPSPVVSRRYSIRSGTETITPTYSIAESSWDDHKEDVREPSPEPDSPAKPTKPAKPAKKLLEVPEDGLPFRAIAPIMLSIYMTLFIVGLDGNIVAPAIPKIVEDFKSFDDSGWYGSAYVMTRCSMGLIFGKLYSFYNTKVVLLSAMSAYMVGSLLSAIAPNSNTLIIGRAFAGIGAAGVLIGAFMSVKFLYPLHKRPVVISTISTIFRVTTVLGPTVGGVFTDQLSWRWCFYINLPLGCTSILLLFFFLNLPPPSGAAAKLPLKQQLLKLDPLGLSLIIPCIISLLLALQWGGTTYAWNSSRIIGLLVCFSLLFVAFVASQIWLGPKGTIPPHIICQRSILGAFWVSLTTGGAVNTISYYMPIWYQAVKGSTAEVSGVDVLPNVLATIIGALVTGYLMQRLGYYVPFMWVGQSLMAIGSGLLTTWTPSINVGLRIFEQAVYGLGSGVSSSQPSLAAQTVLKDGDVPIGVSMMMFGQGLGASIFIQVGQSLFSQALVQKLQKFGGDLNVQQIINAGADEFRALISNESLVRSVIYAYNSAIIRIFYCTMALSLAALFGTAIMEWRCIKKKAPAGAAPAKPAAPAAGAAAPPSDPVKDAGSIEMGPPKKGDQKV